jgi:hypothetical protein
MNNDDLINIINKMLEAWEDQFGEGACDCMPEPENEGRLCVWCSARFLLGKRK